MTEYNESNYLGDLLKQEALGRYSRDKATILAGAGADRALSLGEVIGKITKGAATEDHSGNTGDGVMAAITLGILAEMGVYVLTCTADGLPTAGAATGEAVAGNTGAGTITGSPTVGAGAKTGIYRITCIEPASGAGIFSVEDPDGIEVGVASAGVEFTGGGLTFTIADGDPDFAAGDAFIITVAPVDADTGTFRVVSPSGYVLPPLTVAVAYTGDHLNMTLADGATDFIVGDVFTITVAAGSGKMVALGLTAVDGSQNAAGIMAQAVTALDGLDNYGVALVRDAVVMASALVWPDGATDDQKTAALAQLAAAGIITREEA